MAKITKLLLCCAVNLILSVKLNAQLSGTYNIPTNYPTLSAAISALNLQGVNGPVIIEMNAGYTETAPVGGYALTATGTLANPIKFRKATSGANPLITAYTGGTGTPSSATQDGIWRFIGCDYITVDGIDLSDGNTSNPSTMEYGYGFFKAGTSDGCQNNTIINCVISLNVINNATGSGPAVDGSRGINVVNSLYTSQTTAMTPVSFAGTNSYNFFYSNSIKNCNVGIALIGYAAPGPFTLADTGNDVGGSSNLQGNTIVNFGGAASAGNPAAGIRTLAQYNLNVSFNTLNNNNGSGTNHVNALRGLYINTATSANLSLTNNTITLKGGGSTVQISAIENLAGATAANNTVSINGNQIINCTYTTNTTGSFLGIYNNAASAALLEINNNSFSAISTIATTGSNYLIYNTGAATNSIRMNNNSVDNCSNAASNSGSYYMFFNNVTSPAALSISNNSFNNSSSSAVSGATHLVYNSSATTGSIILNNNSISNCNHTVTSTGSFYGIYNGGASLANLEMRANTFLNHKINAFSGATHLIYNAASITNSIVIKDNLFSGSTQSITSTGSFYGVYNNAASSANLDISSNTFSANISVATSGSLHLIFNRGANTNTFTTNALNNNLVSNCSFSTSLGAPFLGIYNNGVTSGNLSLSNNTLTGNTWTTPGSVKYMIYNTGGVSGILNMNNNLVANSTSTINTTGAFNGINNVGTCTVALSICNNAFTNFYNSSTTGGTYLMFNSGAVPAGVITMTNNAVSGFTNTATGPGDFYGIYNSGTTFFSLDVSANKYTGNQVNSSTGVSSYITNVGAVSSTNNSINLSSNVIANCTSSVNSSGSFFGIYNNGASGLNLSMSNNTYTNNTSYVNNGANHFIYNRGAITNTFATINLNNNLFANCSHSASAGAGFYSLWNNGVTSTVTSINGNTITAGVWLTGTSLRYLISNWGVALNSATINNNLISNCTHTNNTTGSLYGIYNNNNTSVSSGSLIISNNTYSNNLSTATTGETHYFNNSGVITNTFTSAELTNNLLANCSSTVTNSGAWYGFYNNTASSNNLNISQNTFTNSSLTSSTGSTYFIYNRGVASNLFATVTATNNLLSGITHSNSSNGVFYGIVNSGAATTSCSVLALNSNTFINSISSGTIGQINLLYNTCPVTNSISISNNLFKSFTNSITTTAAFFGISNGGNSSAGNLSISDNVFTNLISTASTGSRYLIYNTGGISNSITITGNFITACSHSISSNGSLFYAYNNSASSGLSASINNNTLTNNSSSSISGSTYLLVNSGAVTSTISNVSLSNNIIDNYNNAATSGPFYGITNSGFTSANLSITSNTLSTITTSATGATQQLLFNNGKITNTLSIADNLISGYTNTLNTGGTFYGIINGANFANGNFPTNFNITNNSIRNTLLNSTTGSIYFINNSGIATNTITTLTINNNLISNASNSISSTGALYGVYNAAISSGSLTVNSNTFTNIAATTTSSSRYMIYNGGLIVNGADFRNNLVSNFTSTLNTGGNYFGINNGGNSQGDLRMSDNTFLNHILAATSGTAYMIYNSGIITNAINMEFNLVSNLSHSASAAGVFLGVYNNGGTAASLNIASNTFTNISIVSTTGPFHLFYNRGSATNTISSITFTNNTARACTYVSPGGQFYGVFNSGTTFSNLSIGSNTFINTICTSTTAPRYFIYNTGAGLGSMDVKNNSMSGFTSSVNTTASFYGINNGGSMPGDLTITNNRFLNHTLSATAGSAFVIYNSGVVANVITIGSNSVAGLTHSATTSGGFLGLCNAATSSASLSISTNTLTNLILSTSTGATHYIYNRGAASSTISAITVSDNVVSGLTYSANSGPFYGLFNSATSFSVLNIGNNLFSNIVSTSSTSPRYFFYNTGAGSGSISLNSNSVLNYQASGNTTGLFYNALNTGTCSGNLEISGNTFSTEVLPSTTSAAYNIYNTGLVTGSVSINNNSTRNLTHTSTTGIFYGIYSSAASYGNLSIGNNSLNTISTTNSVGIKYLIYNTSASSNNISLSNNSIANYSAALNTTGNFAGIYNTGNSQGGFEASGNTFTNITVPATTGTCYVIYNTGTVTTASDISNNLVTSLTNSSSAAGTFFGLYNLASNSSSFTMSGNTFSNTSVTVPTLAIYLLYNNGTATTSISSININNNSVFNFTNTLGQGNFYGMYNNAVSSASLSLSGNTFINCTSATTNSLRYMVYNTGSVTSRMDFSDNTVANCTSSLNTTANFYGVYNSAYCGGDLNMNRNSFTNNFLESTTGTNYLVYNSAAVSNTIGMNTNTVSGNTNSLTSSGDFYGIYNTSPSSTGLSMDGNLFSNNTSAATSANTYLVSNSGAVSASVSISNNSLGYSFTNNTLDYSGTLYNIYNAGGTPATTLTTNGNTFLGHVFSGVAGSGNIYFIHNANNNARWDASGNSWTNLALKHNGNEYLIFNPSNTSGQLNVTNNTVSGYTRTANAAALFMYYSNGSSLASCTQVFSGNSFSNISAGTQGTGSFYGIYNMDGTGSSYPKKSVFNNSISNINYNALGFFYGYYFDFLGDNSSTGSSIYSNTLSAVSWGGPLYGLYIGSNISSAFAASVYSNTIFNLGTSGTTSDIHGAYLSGTGTGLNFYQNKISDLTSTGILGTATGIKVSGASLTTLHNNLIGNISTPVSQAASPINGINITGGARVNVYYNTVYLNAVGTGSAFGSNALLASSSVSVALRNNILINTSTPNGNGQTVAYRRTTSSLANYLNVSNNNLFYAGIPGINRLIFTDGTTSKQTLPSFQTLVTPRDNVSVSENTSFLSTAGSNTNFLHVDVGIPSLTESGAVNIAGLTEDFDGQTRQGNAGYSGTGTAPDIGADEYNQNLIPCASANAGTVTVPSTLVKCAGESVYLLSTGSTAAGNIVNQWKVATTAGGPYTNVTGGTGANYVAYTTPTLTAGNYYYVLVTTCNNGPVTGTSNEVTVTVHAGPTASASLLNSSICSGESLNFNAVSNLGINYNWQGPNNFTSTIQNPTINNAVTSSSGTYTLLVSDANCTSNPVFVSATVNPTPPAFSLTPQTSSICIGSSQTITASIPITSPTLTFGNQTNQNTASGYPAPYSVYYGGQKMQMLILAGELSAAGFTTGTPIQSVQFPVASLGGNWGSTLQDCQNFMVGMKATTVSALSVFETGVSNVVPSTNFTPVPGYSNTHTFSAPFIWDGSSNLVIETVFSNSVIGGAGNTVIQYNSPVGFHSTLVYRADNLNVSAIAAATTSNINVGFVRPDFKLNGTQVGTYSWSPSNGLSSTSGVSVIASPTASAIYSVGLSDGLCASNSTVGIDVILVPTITISSSSSTVCLGNTATLTAAGATTYTWNTNATTSNVVVSPFGTTTYTVNGSNPICPSSSATIQIISAPALTLAVLASPAILCIGESSTLSVSGASTYTWTGGSNTSSIVVSPSGTTNYSVTGASGPGCRTGKNVNVKVNPLPVIIITPSSPTICLGEMASVEASGVFNFTWAPGNSNSPILMVSPVNNTSYTVVGTDQNNCSNTASVEITVQACVGIGSLSSSSKAVSVYPNPSSGIITLQFASEEKKQVDIVNSMGSSIYSAEITGDLKKIDLSEFSKGVYFVKIKGSGLSGTYKLILD